VSHLNLFTSGLNYLNMLLGQLGRLGSPFARESRPIDHLVAPIRRPLDRAWGFHSGRLGDLGRLGDSVSRERPAQRGKRVLVLSLRMWAPHTAYQSVIAQALRVRGADVALLTCGGGQPICEVGWGRRVAPRPCDRCAYFTDRVASRGRLPQIRLVDEFPWGQAPDHAPVELGSSRRLSRSDAAVISTAWFTQSAHYEQTPDGAAVKRDFEISLAAVETAFGKILDRFRPDVVLAQNGLFAAERAVRAVAAERDVRVVTYENTAREGTLVFSETGAAPETATDALWEEQRSRPLSTVEAAQLDSLIQARETGTGAHERYFSRPPDPDGEAVRAALNIRPGIRVISAFTNLAWDSALLGKDVAYESQFDWLTRTLQTVAKQGDTLLVIRVHPAESRWGTAQPVEAEVKARFGELPPNVLLVRPDEPVSSYGLLAVSDLVLCYTTTIGLEAAVRGIPVAVAGETHYRGRGFTSDLRTHADLEKLVAELPKMSPHQMELARRYAFAYFFRCMIPFHAVQTVDHRLTEVAVSAEALTPGRDPHLDLICDRILDGGDFFLPPDLATLS
jgi:Capsule polysaccharide biosynthesis protein